MMTLLFSPLKIKDITLRNRITVSPMCMYSAENGLANDWHLAHYGARAIGGAGLIIQEATAVAPEGRITPGDLGIWDNAHIEPLRKITHFIQEQGAIAGIQVAHAGRKASCAAPWDGGHQLTTREGGWTTLSSSSLPFNPEEMAPAELDGPGIDNVVEAFRDAASRAVQAGFNLLEIHAAHGYLIHQFLSPLCNRREDNYGGSFENRTRLIREIITAVKTKWPANLPLFVRLSATDYIEGGWDVDQTVQLAKILKNEGVDLIDSSSGGMVPYAKIPFGPGYQVPFADRIRREAGIMTGAVGMITGADQAEEILKKGQADLILIARQSLRDPNFPLNAARALGAEVDWPRQYRRAKN